jgi:hypothetical protein
MRQPGDKGTGDLFSWRAPAQVVGYPEEKIRAATIGAKVSKAVSVTLLDAKARKSDPLDRDQVALAMGAFLGEDLSKDVLDAYASQAREGHNISVVRALGLMEATGDYRLLVLMAEQLGLAVIHKKYERAVEEAMTAEKIEELQRHLDHLRRGRKS